MTTTPRKRKTTDELLAEAEERTRQLKARKRSEMAKARERQKAEDRKKRARVLIEIGGAFTAALRTQTKSREAWLDLLATTDVKDQQRRAEALKWLRQELGLPEPAPAPAAHITENGEFIPPQADAVQQPPAQ